MNPFDVVTDVGYSKKGIISKDNEKDYAPFLVNRSMSYFIDTLYYAQEMNINPGIDNLLQYDYYFNSVPKKKRFSKWTKKVVDEDVEFVAEYYNYGYKRAEEACKILSKEHIARIKDCLTRGRK